MALAEIPDNIKKVERSEFLTFLNTTPNGNSKTWAILGVGVTEYAIAYNPQVDTEKWIIEDNARTDHSSNQKQGSVTQKIYKNDPCFEYIANNRDNLNIKTEVLDVDTWNGTSGSYPAKLSNATIVITSYMGENAEIEYDLYYDGDPEVGTVTIAGGVPTFTPSVSV